MAAEANWKNIKITKAILEGEWSNKSTMRKPGIPPARIPKIIWRKPIRHNNSQIVLRSLHELEDCVHHLCVVMSVHLALPDVLAPLAVRSLWHQLRCCLSFEQGYVHLEVVLRQVRMLVWSSDKQQTATGSMAWCVWHQSRNYELILCELSNLQAKRTDESPSWATCRLPPTITTSQERRDTNWTTMTTSDPFVTTGRCIAVFCFSLLMHLLKFRKISESFNFFTLDDSARCARWCQKIVRYFDPFLQLERHFRIWFSSINVFYVRPGLAKLCNLDLQS